MTAPPALAAAARLEGQRSQRAFRALLDTSSRPGTVVDLAAVALPADVPPALVVALALADVEVAVAVLGDDDGAWWDLVRDATGARPAPPDAADVVVALGPLTAADVTALRRGTAEEPERGARLAVACAGLHPGDAGGDADGDVVLMLAGPGIDGHRRLGLDGVAPAAIDALVGVNAAFPRGVDTWLATPDGRLVALPRSTRIRRLDPEET